jgi:hypothetical protein
MALYREVLPATVEAEKLADGRYVILHKDAPAEIVEGAAFEARYIRDAVPLGQG